MKELAERAYFGLCLALARLLRSVKYSKVRIVHEEGEVQVRKRRSFYAPLLVWLSGPLIKILDAGVRVLPQRDWEERERQLYRSLRGTSVRREGDETLVLSCLPGMTLAALLEDSRLDGSVREKAIELSVVALAEFHRLGFTHGDAMADNVLVDLEAGIAHWFDFETIHEPTRTGDWRRADDVRALLTTCLLRTAPDKLAPTLRHILSAYPDAGVGRLVATHFTTAWQRPLTVHLSQAGISFERFREIARLLRAQVNP